jgi:UDP-glucose 4-epimerase
LALAGKPLPIFGDGKQTRDFIYVNDIVAALEFVVSKPELTGTFNAGYGERLSIEELAHRIIELAGSDSAVEFHPSRVGDVRHSMAAIDRLKDEGFCPEGNLNDGLQKMLGHIRSERPLVEQLSPSAR